MILCCGGAGSIGSEVVRRLVKDGESVRVMDINEEGLWSLKQELPDVDCMLGDVQGQSDCFRAMRGCEGIVYCAAMKHVDLCEGNQHLARAVNAHSLYNFGGAPGARFVYVSTDKAIEPCSVMGLSKLEGETIARDYSANVVRFGNVIGTRGSLVPMVQRCAFLNRPIPLTDPAMTRWMMSVDEAVDLILTALRSSERGRVFSPVAPQAVNIGRFIELCRDELAPDCKIVRTQMRPGERLHEPMEVAPHGSIVWSNDPFYAMSDADMLHLIEGAVCHA